MLAGKAPLQKLSSPSKDLHITRFLPALTGGKRMLKLFTILSNKNSTASNPSLLVRCSLIKLPPISFGIMSLVKINQKNVNPLGILLPNVIKISSPLWSPCLRSFLINSGKLNLTLIKKGGTILFSTPKVKE